MRLPLWPRCGDGARLDGEAADAKDDEKPREVDGAEAEERHEVLIEHVPEALREERGEHEDADELHELAVAQNDGEALRARARAIEQLRGMVEKPCTDASTVVQCLCVCANSTQ